MALGWYVLPLTRRMLSHHCHCHCVAYKQCARLLFAAPSNKVIPVTHLQCKCCCIEVGKPHHRNSLAPLTILCLPCTDHILR